MSDEPHNFIAGDFSASEWKLIRERDEWKKRAEAAEAKLAALSTEAETLLRVQRTHGDGIQALLDGQNRRLYEAARERDALLPRVRDLEAKLAACEADAAKSVAWTKAVLGSKHISFENCTFPAEGTEAIIAGLQERLAACEGETAKRIASSLVELADQYSEGDMVEQCDFTAEGIGVAVEWIRGGEWRKGGEDG